MNKTPMQSPTLLYVALVLGLLIAPVTALHAQTTPNQLYFDVQRAQLALGMGEGPDQVRDEFFIRHLETEAAKGFTADLQVLKNIASQFANGDVPAELSGVQSALDNHIAAMESGQGVDIVREVTALDTELQEIDFESFESSRERVLGAINEMDEIHKTSLSNWGRMHLNKNRLQLAPLVQRLEDFEFRVPDIDPEEFLQRDDETDDEFQERISELDSRARDDFNRSMNSLRNDLAQARQRFGQTWLAYDTPAMAISERNIQRLEEQVSAYLLTQSRRRPVFEELLQTRKQSFISQDGQPVDPSDRRYQAELGRWLGFLGTRDQVDGLDAAARRQFSRPNLMITVQESLANRIGGQGISQVDHVDEVILGSRAQGFSYTSGSVSLDFVNSAHSGWVRINLGGTIQTSTYTKEGPVTAYTNSGGSYSASRDMLANVGNLSIYEPQGWAQMCSSFLGTNCGGLVNRLANRQFSQKKPRADEISSERARGRVMEQFASQTDDALSEGVEQLSETRGRRDEVLDWFKQLRGKISLEFSKNEKGELQGPIDMIDPFVLPRVFVNSTDSALKVGGVLEADNRLAAPTDPPATTIPVDVRVQLHESMLSNAVAPFLQNRLLENWKLRNTVESLMGDAAGELPAEADDRPFAIRFEDGRPIQFEFDNNQLGLSVYGKEFRQGGNSYDDPLNIKVRFNIIKVRGELYLVRADKAIAEFTYDPLPGKTMDVGFKSFLQDNLDKALSGDPREQAIALPSNLIPLDNIEDEEVKARLANAKLVELSMDNGWLTLGWNYIEGGGEPTTTYMPAVQEDDPEAGIDEIIEDPSLEIESN